MTELLDCDSAMNSALGFGCDGGKVRGCLDGVVEMLVLGMGAGDCGKEKGAEGFDDGTEAETLVWGVLKGLENAGAEEVGN